ncbi:hypothetical protein ACFL4Z_02090 [candidate division KSB1 bacterium]
MKKKKISSAEDGSAFGGKEKLQLNSEYTQHNKYIKVISISLSLL